MPHNSAEYFAGLTLRWTYDDGETARATVDRGVQGHEGGRGRLAGLTGAQHQDAIGVRPQQFSLPLIRGQAGIDRNASGIESAGEVRADHPMFPNFPGKYFLRFFPRSPNAPFVKSHANAKTPQAFEFALIPRPRSPCLRAAAACPWLRWR